MRLRPVFQTILAIIFFILVFPQVAMAVEFGPNSDKITNPYTPFKVGSWMFMQGFGPNWANRIFYIHMIGKETVSGAKIGEQVFNKVKCCTSHVIITDDGGGIRHEFFTFSVAQDTDGNVWVLKVYSHMANVNILLGGEYFHSMFMPAVPAVGLPAGIKMPEDEQNYCRIVEIGIDSFTTMFGTFNDCIKVNCYDEDPDGTQVEYYCPDVGQVRTTPQANPTDFMDFKESGTSSLNRVIVIPLGQ